MRLVLSIFGVSLQFITYSLALNDNDDLIVGGETAYIEDFPFIVAIFYNGKHLCGGSLLSATHVLTACHCVVNTRQSHLLHTPLKNYKLLLMLAGTVNERSKKSGIRSKARGLRKHPKCSKTRIGWVYDFGLIIALKVFPHVRGRIETAPLPSFKNISLQKLANSYADCVGAGWGKTEEGGRVFSPLLLKVELKMIPFRACARRLNAYALYLESDLRFSKTSQLCTVGSGEKDACHGDSGGPLMCHMKTGGEPILCAIVSWGHGCGRRGVPGVWARLDVAEPWIRKTLACGTRFNHLTFLTIIFPLIMCIKMFHFALLSCF